MRPVNKNFILTAIKWWSNLNFYHAGRGTDEECHY